MKKNVLISKKRVSRLIMVAIGAFFAALVYNAYVVPNNVVYSGVGGLAIIVKNWTGLNTTIFINLVTVFLIIMSLILLGLKGTSYSLIGFVIYDIMINVTSPFAHLFNVHFDSYLFSIILYAIINGTAVGSVYRTGFNLGGSDILICILQKYFKVPSPKISNKMNAVVIVLGAFTFGITLSLYAVIFLVTTNFFSSRRILGASNSKICFIKTRKNDELEEFLIDELELGYTVLDSTNGIGKLNKKIIMCVVPTDRFYDLKREIIKLDKRAEIISSDCYTVEGGKTNNLISV